MCPPSPEVRAVVHTCSSSRRTPDPLTASLFPQSLPTPALYRHDTAAVWVLRLHGEPGGPTSITGTARSLQRPSTSLALPFRTHEEPHPKQILTLLEVPHSILRDRSMIAHGEVPVDLWRVVQLALARPARRAHARPGASRVWRVPVRSPRRAVPRRTGRAAREPAAPVVRVLAILARSTVHRRTCRPPPPPASPRQRGARGRTRWLPRTRPQQRRRTRRRTATMANAHSTNRPLARSGRLAQPEARGWRPCEPRRSIVE